VTPVMERCPCPEAYPVAECTKHNPPKPVTDPEPPDEPAHKAAAVLITATAVCLIIDVTALTLTAWGLSKLYQAIFGR
jgi:hypothetical protein